MVILPTGGTGVKPTYFPDLLPFMRQKLSAAGCRVGNSSASPSNIQKRLSAATGKIEVKASATEGGEGDSLMPRVLDRQKL